MPPETIGRRSFLSFAAAALAAPRALRAQDPPRRVRGVIWLWMDGGMPQVHTWDPKPGLTSKIIETQVPGIQFSEFLPQCAAQAKHLSIIRSLSHPAGDHAVATRLMHTAGRVGMDGDVPAIGTILAAELGAKDAPLPPFMTIAQSAVPTTSRFPEKFQPFYVGPADNPIPDLGRKVEVTRDQERAALLLEQSREWNQQHQQAAVRNLAYGLEMSEAVMNSGLLRAFDVFEEPPELRRDYGESFGLNCLMARRLVEAGCPFVEVALTGWDTCLNPVVEDLDRGLGALLRDLRNKGLLSDVLVVCATEFGKVPTRHFRGVTGQPQIENFSVALAGGALRGGRVVGDPKGTPRVSVGDLFATIYKACGVDFTKSYESEGRTFKYLDAGKPLDSLF